MAEAIDLALLAGKKWVAVMTDLLDLKPDDLVLEIGTGRGYQAAVLAELAGRVYSVELIDELGQRAGQLLTRQGYTNIDHRHHSPTWPIRYSS